MEGGRGRVGGGGRENVCVCKYVCVCKCKQPFTTHLSLNQFLLLLTRSLSFVIAQPLLLLVAALSLLLSHSLFVVVGDRSLSFVSHRTAFFVSRALPVIERHCSC